MATLTAVNPQQNAKQAVEEKRVYENMREFVQVNGGSHVIKRILIANNGCAAIKAIRSIRTWNYETFGNEKEVEFVAMATKDDIEANAEYISEADFFVEVPAGPNNNNYANINLIVQLAEENACDAVWPGWGHASEKPELPAALLKAKRKIIWIGPRPQAMIAIGDKIGSTIIAQSAGVACVPWSGDGVVVGNDFNPNESLSMDLIRKACVKSGQDVIDVCKRIGYPVMIKASEGGGGKGIRKCTKPEEAHDAFRQVVNEVKGSPVFVMKMVSRCRHLEVQMFGDAHGNVTSLGSRDCSIQRRNQKVIEEGPVSAAPFEKVREMEDAAVRMAKMVGYYNAGTMEFLFDPETNNYYFMEVNARLQVEHVVTELTSECNIPAAQLQVAMGLTLDKIKDVKAFMDFREKSKTTNAKRHCIAARITAEHAEAGWRPTSGAVNEIAFRSSRNVWGYFSLGSKGRIHAYADSQFGHLFASGPTREDARNSLIMALKNLTIRGEIRTNTEALIRILETSDYCTNKTYTTWLEACVGFSSPINSRKVQHSTLLAVMLGAMYEAAQHFKKSEADFNTKVSQGQLPPPLVVTHDVELCYRGNKFTVHCTYSGANQITLDLNGSHVEASFHFVSANGEGGFLVSGGFDGRSRMVFWKEDSAGVSVTYEGSTYTFTRETDPTQVRAPVSGKLVRWLAANDTQIAKGQPYCEIEIMKMYMQLPCHETGKISHALSEGAVFQAGDLLATLELPEGMEVSKATPFTGEFPVRDRGCVKPGGVQNPLRALRMATQKLRDCMGGYVVNKRDAEWQLSVFQEHMFNSTLPVMELKEILSVLATQLPETVNERLNELTAMYDGKQIAPGAPALPTAEIMAALEQQFSQQQQRDYSGPTLTRQQVEPLIALIKKYERGVVAGGVAMMSELLQSYAEVEELFHAGNDVAAKVLQGKRTEFDQDKMLRFARAHQNLKGKTRLVLKLLEYIRATPVLMEALPLLADVLSRLSNLSRPEYSAVSLRARQLLLTKKQKPFNERTLALEAKLADLAERLTPATHSVSALVPLIADLATCPDDSLVCLLAHPTGAIRKLAMEIYVRRHYERHGLHDLRSHCNGESWTAKAGEVLGSASPTSSDHLNRGGSFDTMAMLQANGTLPSTELTLGTEQTVNSLLSVWSHKPIVTQDFLREACDKLAGRLASKPAAALTDGKLANGDVRRAEYASSGVGRESSLPNEWSSVGVSQSNVLTHLTSPPHHPPIPGLQEGSRLHHMLSALGSGNGQADMHLGGNTQHTIAMCFGSFSEFEAKFEDALTEVVQLAHAGVGVFAPTAKGDGRNLLVLIADIDKQLQGRGSSKHPLEEVPVPLFSQVLQRPMTAMLLKELALFLVSLAFVQPAAMPSARSPRRDSELPAQAAPQEGIFRVSDLVSQCAPSYLHFRCRLNLPAAVKDAPLSPALEKATEGTEGAEEQVAEQQQQSGVCVCDFQEESLLRHVEVPLLTLLELKRLSNFRVKMIPTSSHNVHLYEALPLPAQPAANGTAGASASSAAKPQSRFFVRILMRNVDSEEHFAEQERYMVAGLNALEVAARQHGNYRAGSADSAGNHVLMTTTASVSAKDSRSTFSHSSVEAACRKFWARYEQRLQQNAVATLEFRYLINAPHGSEQPLPLRVVLDNPTGQSVRVRKFLEVRNPATGEQVFSALDVGGGAVQVKRDGDYDGRPVEIPHPLASPMDMKRAMAASLSTVYVYDFLDLFEEAVKKQWKNSPKYFFNNPAHAENDADGQAGIPLGGSYANLAAANGANPALGAAFLPERAFEAVEMALNARGELEDVYREAGKNDVGMVAWRVKMCTPEFPRGRRMIVIANDVTFQMGTFGVQEDLLFQRASELARQQGIPRIYVAANSGARMGLASEVQKAFKIEWSDPAAPAKGFKYIYLTEKDYKRLKASDSVVAEPLEHPTEGKVWRITDIIGQQIGLGVENLCGSGAIAGETSRAYRECFTITFVTGRSVGIGAYLTRLGQRVIQKVAAAPLLLTGYQALNRLIGRDVYTSNEEIGGIDVMHKNGVSHLVVRDDIEGCQAIIDWLSYVPEHRDGPLPILVDSTDPINRLVQYKQQSSTEDPRLMFTGCVDQTGTWLGGIFDRNSFKETMSEWAKSVIVGRARLGGFPIGVIAVETRVTEACQPADPAMPQTSELKLMRAGQVWYPDSAYKTAQAIQDLNQEELPLMVFANWRGFSGGQRDMFDEVLKFGSFIVDALVDFKQPCFVYIPPKAELRGGAWVVVDPRINQEYMEMYADVECRGGVLEPTGTVEIKYREKQLIETANRLDPTLQQLIAADRELAAQGVAIDAPPRVELKERRDRRVAELLPVYKQVALHFADLHDTAMRMKKKHAVHDVVSWEKARQFFYWRLRRQLILFGLRSEIVKACPSLSLSQAERLVYQWAEDAGVESNYQFVQWSSSSVKDVYEKVQLLRKQHIKDQTHAFCKESLAAVWDALREADPQRTKFVDGLSIAEKRSAAGSLAASQTALERLTNPNANMGGRRGSRSITLSGGTVPHQLLGSEGGHHQA